MKHFVGFSLVLVLAMEGAFGQGEQGKITGTVTDTTGAVVVGARVSLRNQSTNITITTQTNDAGLYLFPSLNPDSYDLTVEMTGFRARKITKIPLSIGLTATVDVKLDVGQVTESVEVTASAVQLEAQTSGMGKTVEARRVVELPLLGRNPLALGALAPGVIPTRGQVGFGGDAIGTAANARISGGLAMQNAVLMDGAESRGFTSGGQFYAVPLESVGEFKIETATYSAEYGRAGGGVINVATKSGTNEYHGTLYEYLRNDHLNANSWANNRTKNCILDSSGTKCIGKSLFQRNEYGVAGGGAIKKNKTFFFANYEAIRQGTPNNFLSTVPTAAEKNGDFSKILDRFGQLDVIYDYSTTRLDPNTGKVARDPFAGNIIPANRIHPISKNVATYWPDPNRPNEGLALLNNYSRSGKNVNNIDAWFLRLDHQINDKHRVFGRFGGSQNESFAAGLVEAAFPATTISSNPTRTGQISLSSTFSPTFFGEFRFAYTRLQNNSYPISEGFDLATLGFPKSLSDAVTYKQFPQISVQQYNSGSGLVVSTYGANEVGQLGGATKVLVPQDTYHAQYHVTKTKGTHTIKAGVDLQRMKMAAFNSQYSAGQYYFDRAYSQGPDPAVTATNSGNGFASFLLGVPASGTITTTPYMMLFQRYSSGYVQDDWRVNSKLTLNLGFRYEYTSPYGEKYGQIGYLDIGAVDPVTGQKGLFKWTPPGGYHTDPKYKTFGPRVGLAYQLNPKTVIRAAGAIFNAANNGLNAAASDFGTGLFTSNFLTLGAPNPLGVTTPPVGGSWSNPFAGGLVLPQKGVSTFVGQSIRIDVKDHPLAYLENWNFSIQRMLRQDLLLEVGYVGSHTVHLFWNRQDNASNPLLLQQLGTQIDSVVPNPYFGKIQGGALSFPTIPLKQLLRPFPQYQDVLHIRAPYGDAEYQSMVARVEKRMSKGYTISLSYTLSKLIASTAESNTWVVGPSNALYDPKYNRSIEANDTPHRVAISHLWEIPVGFGQPHLNRGIAARVLGNWQFNGISIIQAGRPILITGPDNTHLYSFSYTNGRADRLRSAVIDNPTPLKYFDTTAFKAAAPFTIPTDSLSQPDLRTPWRKVFNFSFYKNNPITIRDRKMNLQFRGEVFNVFNTPQFDLQGASTDVTSPQFGQIIAAGAERNVQLALKFIF